MLRIHVRRLFAALAGTLTTVAVVGAGTVLAAPAHAVDDGYWKASWSTTIYLQHDDGLINPVTYDQWKAAGFPTPQTATDHYERFSWSPVIYRSTSFGAYQRFVLHIETADEWVAAGRPAPELGDINHMGLDKWGTSPEVFATPPDKVVHKLTAAEYAPYNVTGDDGGILNHPDQGFEKLSWAPEIAKMSSLAHGTGSPITYAQWRAQDFPTPRAVTRFPGDSFYRHRGSSTIYYSGPTLNRAISYAEWTAAGKPTPVVK